HFDGFQTYRHQNFFDQTEGLIFFKKQIEIDEIILEIDRKIEEKQLIRVKNSQIFRFIAPKFNKLGYLCRLKCSFTTKIHRL
ncbi:MAG: hypothetical protein IKX17_03965, partial [Prevotella sp.]|nr:hypothetical protein [Prevotella sp.]